MKTLSLLVLSLMIVSCSSANRQLASEEQQNLQQTERIGDFGPGYRH